MSSMRIKNRVRAWHNAGPLTVVLAVAMFLMLLGLGNNAFWDDEANTALFARNLNQSGHLAAWDGANVIGFRQGAELNSHLVNVYMPPVQYYVAALGLKLFGPTTVGGRLPFVMLGLLSIVALVLTVRWHFRRRVVEWLPALLVVLNPAYLMFMRQCRYYSVVALLSLMLLAGFCHPKKTTRSLVIAAAVGGVTALLLMLTNYMNAVAIGLVLPLLFHLGRYRTRQNLAYLGVVYCALIGVGAYVLVTANPLALSVTYKSTVTGLHRVALLLWWHITGLAQFEFFPTITVPLLLGYWFLQRKVPSAKLPREGLLLCLLLFLYSVTIVAFSPQSIDASTSVADMRYVVVLVPIGAMATAVMLVEFSRSATWFGRVTALCVGVLLVTTNVFTSAFMNKQPLRSTLFEYLWENTHDYTTGSETVIAYLKTLPQGRVVRIIPDFMTYPAMFYAPQQHYCCQLNDDHVLEPKLRAQLPDYVYLSRVLPDYLLVGAAIDAQQLLYQSVVAFGTGKYRLGPVIGTDYRDCSRPEMPWHCFRPGSESRRGFLVLERVGSEPKG